MHYKKNVPYKRFENLPLCINMDIDNVVDILAVDLMMAIS